jgi:hypothetical protein
MRKIISFLFSGVLLATTLVGFAPSPASAATTLITCTDLVENKTTVLKIDKKSCKSFSPSAMWHLQLTDSSDHSGIGFATLRVCSSKNLYFTYQFIQDACPKHQVTTNYWRAVSTPQTPDIATVSARGHDSVLITLTPTSATTNSDSPVSYYLVTDAKTGVTTKVLTGNLGWLYLSGLLSESTHAFTIAAVSVDGISPHSASSTTITIGAVPVVIVAPVAVALAAPIFTLSASSETRTVNTAATGFTISSTGGTIASFAINATPPGMSFGTSTGVLTGAPNTVASATTYAVTATNASGSTTRSFTLTVTAATARYCDGTSFTCEVGDTGPGGGKIFYYAAAGFACGPAFNVTGSPTGGKCYYLEVAPKTWDGAIDPLKTWAIVAKQSEVANTTGDDLAVGIGRGYQNSDVIVGQGNDTTTAAGAARAYSGGSKNDWYLPARPELNELFKWANGNVVQPPLGTVGVIGSLNFSANGFSTEFDFTNVYYWSSSEDRYERAWNQSFKLATSTYNVKSDSRRVRPIRAF